MEFEPKKRNRLAGYDYSRDGYYFVTAVTKGRAEILSKIVSNRVELSNQGILLKKNNKKHSIIL
jgi:hypothetical protein